MFHGIQINDKLCIAQHQDVNQNINDAQIYIKILIKSTIGFLQEQFSRRSPSSQTRTKPQSGRVLSVLRKVTLNFFFLIIDDIQGDFVACWVQGGTSDFYIVQNSSQIPVVSSLWGRGLEPVEEKMGEVEFSSSTGSFMLLFHDSQIRGQSG